MNFLLLYLRKGSLCWHSKIFYNLNDLNNFIDKNQLIDCRVVRDVI